jgi:large subunit ribosomal protein L4
MKLTVLNKTQETKKEFKSPILEGKGNEVLIAQALRVYLANQRQGTSKAKTRGEVSRTKRKWYKQKGTGGARHGARSANIFVGGGVVHGPNGQRNWSLNLSKRMKAQAFIEIFTKQAKASKIYFCDEIESLDGKTKSGLKLLQKHIDESNRVLIIVDETNDLILRSLNNIGNILVKCAKNVSLLEISLTSRLILTSKAFKALENRLIKTEKKVEVEKEIKFKEETKVKKEIKVEKKTKVKKDVKKEVKKEVKIKKDVVKKIVKAKVKKAQLKKKLLK